MKIKLQFVCEANLEESFNISDMICTGSFSWRWNPFSLLTNKNINNIRNGFYGRMVLVMKVAWWCGQEYGGDSGGKHCMAVIFALIMWNYDYTHVKMHKL